MQDNNIATDAEPRSGLGKERVAGLVLVVFGAIALWAGAELPFMTSSGVGSGLLPRILALLIIALGALQLLLSWKNPGNQRAIGPSRKWSPWFWLSSLSQ